MGYTEVHFLLTGKTGRIWGRKAGNFQGKGKVVSWRNVPECFVELSWSNGLETVLALLTTRPGMHLLCHLPL